MENKGKIKIIIEHILLGIVGILIAFTITTIVYATSPNPGHNFTDVSGDVQQGDLLYGSAVDTLSALPKNTSATRYLSNTGTGNNPAWALVNLVNGISGILTSENGGTGNGFAKFSGPDTSEKTFTLPNANATILTDNTEVTVAQGGTGATSLTANNVILGNDTNAVQFVAPGTSGNILTSNGSTWESTTPSSRSIMIGNSDSLTLDSICAPTAAGYSSHIDCSSTLTAVGYQGLMPVDANIKNLRAHMTTAPGAGSSCSFTIRKSTTGLASSFSNTSLSCTVAGNGSNKTCSDTSDTVSISAGDFIQILFDETGTCTGVNYWGFEINPT